MNNLFKFNSVGFGLFYSGIIQQENSIFSFAYDCGGKKALAKKRIKEFATNIFCLNGYLPAANTGNQKPALDMLVISHLHEDHISGIDEIYKNFDVRSVYLPYILRSEVTHYLLYLAIMNGRQSYDLYEKINNLYVGESEGETIVVDNQSSLAPLQADWHFIFFNQHISDEEMQDYMQPIIAVLERNGIDSFESLKNINDERIIIQIKKELQECKNRRLNVTSLTLMHYPEKENASLIAINPETFLGCKNIVLSNDINCQKGKNVTLLTGDALYSQETKDNILQYLNNDRKGVLQVPHHGSYNNWQSMCPEIAGDFQYYVTSGSYTVRYNLPDCRVLGEILKLKKTPTLVHEYQEFAYQVK